jgi:hypothetical protein
LLELEEEATSKYCDNKRKRTGEDEGDDSENEDNDFLDVPSQDQVAKVLLERKKKTLMEKYSL